MQKLSLLLALATIFKLSDASAEYYHFRGPDEEKIGGATILYQETRYPIWCENTYHARWFPGIAGGKSRTSFYSGPAWSGDYEEGVRNIGYIQSFWGIQNPVTPGDSVTPEWWHPHFRDVPSIGEGASGKVEGSWEMRTGVWYPTAIRVWQSGGSPADTAECGQWFKDGVTGQWHHLSTFRIPFAAERFTGDGGFIEDPRWGNRKPHRVDFRNYYFYKNNRWIPGKFFFPSTRQAKEKGTSGLLENDTVAFFETCSAPDYQGNMGPGSHQVKIELKTPDQPTFDKPVIQSAEAQHAPGQLSLAWQLDKTSSPQFAWRIAMFSTPDATGDPFHVEERIDPDAQVLLLSTDQQPASVTLTLTDIFEQKTASLLLVPKPAQPAASKAPPKTRPGLAYDYFEGSWDVLPFSDEAPAKIEPLQRGITNGPDITIHRRTHSYACRFSGFLQIPRDGIWKFSIASSDGSSLKIGPNEIIRTGTTHGEGFQTSGTVALQAGHHPVEILYFKSNPKETRSYDGDSLRLTWQGPGMDVGLIPEDAWSIPANTPPLPMVEMSVRDSGGKSTGISADRAILSARVSHTPLPLRSARFYSGEICVAASHHSSPDGDARVFTSRELPGIGNLRMKARLVFGEHAEFTVDSPSVGVTLAEPDVRPWTFSAIGRHRLPTASSIRDGVHTIVGDGLNFHWQKITGDTTLTARVRRRPSSSWLSQFDGSNYRHDWSGGILFRSNLHGNPGSEIGKTFVTLLVSASNSIHLQDNTNSGGGGLFWPRSIQNADRTYSWLRLKRAGNLFTAFLSVDGIHWDEVESRDLSKNKFPEEMYVGIYTLARPSDNKNINRWQFDSVTIGEGREDTAATPQAQSALVAHWPMDEEDGDGITDTSGNSLDGAIVNAASRVPGRLGQAIHLNGQDQAVLLPPLSLNSNRLTLTGWIKREGHQASWAGVFFSRASQAFEIAFGPGNELRFSWTLNGNPTYNIRTGLVPPEGKWCFVALAVEPNKITLNMRSEGGELQSFTHEGITTVAALDGDTFLGWDNHAKDRRYRGALDDFRLYRRALSPEEIETLSTGQELIAP